MRNVFQSSRQLAFVEKLFAQAGLKLDDFLASGDESALQAHLATLAAPPVAAAPAQAGDVAAQLATAQADLVKAAARLAELESQLSARAAAAQAAEAGLAAYQAGLAAAQVKVAPAEGATAATAADVTAAVEARISVKLAELNARLGEPPVEARITNHPGKAATAVEGLTGIDRVHAVLAAKATAGRN